MSFFVLLSCEIAGSLNVIQKRKPSEKKPKHEVFASTTRSFFQLCSLTAGFGLPTLLLSGALENLHVASVSLRFLSAERAPPPLGASPTRLVSVVLNLFCEIHGRRSPEYDFHMRLPFYDIQDHVCSACPLFVLYFSTYKIIFLTLFIRRYVFFPCFVLFFIFFIRFPDSL